MATLSRKQKQAQTRSSLMQSAKRIFCKRGLERASIDEVAEDAGFTKGAFYANFKSKEELFLAMLDERFNERIEAIDRAFADETQSPPDQARTAGGDLARYMRSDPESERLAIEFASYATRNEPFREELVTRFATLRARMLPIIQRRAESAGLDLDIPLERIVRMAIAIADGWMLWQLLEPDAVDDEMLEEMLALFTIGIGVQGGVVQVAETAS
jgi:AcrR family transcriptional regulator